MGNRGKKAPLVRKPYLRGHWRSRFAAKRGLKILGYQVAFVFLYLFVVQALYFESLALRLPLNLAVVAALFMLLYLDGTRDGANDTAFAEIAYGKQAQGKEASGSELDRCFHRMKGAFSVLVGILPLLLICVVFAFAATEQRYRLGALPEWVAAYEDRADVGLALQYYHQQEALVPQDLMRVAVRLLIFPFVNILGTENRQAILWMERLSPLLLAVIPSGYAVGYLQGENARARLHGEILAGVKKRRKRVKAERKKSARVDQII